MTTIDDSNSAVIYSKPASGHHWTTQSSNSNDAVGGTLALTSHKGATASLTFTGSGVAVYGLVSMTGKADPAALFTVDGVERSSRTFKRTDAKQTHVQFFDSGVIPNGQHTLVVTNLVEGDFLWLDAFLVTANTAVPAVPPAASTPAAVAAPPASVTTTVVQSIVSQVSITRTAFETQVQTLTSKQGATATGIGQNANGTGSDTTALNVTQTSTDTTATDTTAILPTSSSASNSVEGSAAGKKDVPIGAVVGGILGSIFVILFAVFVFLWWRRGKKAEAKRNSGRDSRWTQRGFESVVVPFVGNAPPPPSGTAPSDMASTYPTTSSPEPQYSPGSDGHANFQSTAAAFPNDGYGKRQMAAAYTPVGFIVDPRGQEPATGTTSPDPSAAQTRGHTPGATSHGSSSDAWYVSNMPQSPQDGPPAYPGVQTAVGNRLIGAIQAAEKR